ncbi:hypothetical protein Cni_G22101 [Canna indica]|uniref:Uncharacterized protein n=1 Tax=Canna indica TaxID=4628 RepID=A0AAQ3KW60_9LILI|nr:hypothetical protein Cni_G22101 [Canna indica]
MDTNETTSSHSVLNPIARGGQIITINPTAQLPIKLFDANNYLTWRTQYELLLLRYDLMSYIDDSLPCPLVGDLNRRVWIRQEGLLRHAIMASVDPTITPMVATSPTTNAAWKKLECQYTNKFQSRIYALQDSLSIITKSIKLITKYFNKIRSIVDELAMANASVKEFALIIKIVGGLNLDYNDISVTIRSGYTPISLEELYDTLLGHESFLLHKQEKPLIMAQYTQRTDTTR